MLGLSVYCRYVAFVYYRRTGISFVYIYICTAIVLLLGCPLHAVELLYFVSFVYRNAIGSTNQ